MLLGDQQKSHSVEGSIPILRSLAHHIQTPVYMSTSNQASRLKAIIETAIDGIITIDEHGIVDSINPAAATLFGFREEEVVGKNISMLMPEPDRSHHDQYLNAYLNTGEARIIGIGREVKGQKKNGTIFPFRLAISEVNITEGVRIFTGIIHDLTKRKEAEEQLKQYAEELERSNRELEEFAYVSSHDLQEPLRKIRTFGSRIEDKELENLSAKGKEYLNRMLNASERMQGLIEDLLSFSRVSTKREPFVTVDLNEIAAEVVSDLELLIQESETKMTIHPLPQIEADATQMRQLFQNLISNAIKFSGDKVPELTISSELLKQPGKPDLAQITFKDNGIGFDEKYLDRIFQIFQRLEGRKYEGSGIGLAICKRIANKHGGDITGNSKPGEGATFIVTLARKHPRHEK